MIHQSEQALTFALLCEKFDRHTKDGKTPMVAVARELGKSPSFFSGENSILGRYRRGGIAALERKQSAIRNRKS